MTATNMEHSSLGTRINNDYGGSRRTHKKVNMWIDTLCIPVSEKYRDVRKLAISGLSKVYREADYILVHDEQISRMNKSAVTTDTAIGILSSDWMRRLWTLQEAMLASTTGVYNRLSFQLEGTKRPLNDILWAQNDLMPSYGQDAVEALAQTLTIMTKSSEPTGLNGWVHRWESITKSMEYRSVTRDLQESICVGAARM